MRILIVKLSSLGDVVHAMPAIQDIRRALPQARVDWLVEPGFAPLVQRVEGVAEVIPVALRRWRSAWWTGQVRREFGELRRRLGAGAGYDAVIDLQGLSKSALLGRLARLAPGGHRFGLGNRTEGAGWEPAARWLVDRPIAIEPHIHAMERSRVLCAKALGYTAAGRPRYGLLARPAPPVDRTPTVAFVHGTSRDDKLWPHAHWIALGKRVLAQGWRIVLPQGSEAEQTRAEMIAAALQFERAPVVQVWTSAGLDAQVDRLAGVQGVIGVDSGLSHIAVALNLPHVQIYNFATAWRTGPQLSHGHAHQISVGDGGRSVPSVDAVWSAWQSVMPETLGATAPR